VRPGSKGSATRPRTEYPTRVRLGRGGKTSPAAHKGLVHPSSLLLGGGTCRQDLDGRPGTEYPLRQPLTQPPSAFDPSLLALRGGRQLQALFASRVRLERPSLASEADPEEVPNHSRVTSKTCPSRGVFEDDLKLRSSEPKGEVALVFLLCRRPVGSLSVVLSSN
jgi:hypothetical protein